MPQLSDRIRGIVGASGDDGWQLFYRARAMAAAGEPLVMLTIGDHDVTTDPAILAAMRESQARGHLGYAPVEGTPGLRRAIAARVTARSATPAEPAQVQVVPGGQAGLSAAMTAVLDPGASCVVIDPYYATYLQTVRAAGGVPVVVGARAAAGFQPDADAIEAALGPDTRAILLNTPNNPTGAVYAPERLEAIAELCRRRDLWLISDEVYDAQVHEGRHLSPRDLPGMAGRTIVVNSLSKSFAMTGARIGWVLAPAEVSARIGHLSITTVYGVAGFIQDAAEFALTQGPEIEAGIAARYRRRRDAALEALAGCDALSVQPPQGGMYLMLDIRATGLSGTDFAGRLLEAERIVVMPGESFGTAAAGHLRVALTRPEALLRVALGRIADFARRLRAG